jgi:hypothetical protein
MSHALLPALARTVFPIMETKAAERNRTHSDKGGFPTCLRRRKNALLLSGVLIVPFTVTAEFGRADGVRLEVTNTRPQ